MRTMTWKDAVEIIGILAIVAGLYFVYEELKQARTIARAELSAESNRLTTILDERVRTPEFAAVIVKGKTTPEALTHVERLQLNSYYWGVLRVFMRERYNYQRGIFETWKEIPSVVAPQHFASGYGRAYWEVRRKNFPPDIVSVVDEALQNRDLVKYYATFDQQVLDALAEH